MNKVTLFVLLMTFHGLTAAQVSNFLPSSVAIAHTSVARTDGCWTNFGNPATLGFVGHRQATMQFENRFLMKELSTKGMQLGLPSGLLNTGLSFSYSGYSLYHEMLMGLALARNFSDKFALGMNFNYYTAYFAATDSYRGALVSQVGLLSRLSPKFALGFHAFNPFQATLKAEYSTKRIPSVFSLGTEYYFSPELAWRTQADKEISYNYRFATGFEYQMLQQLSVKLGAYGTDYLVPCLGAGVGLGRLRFDFNCEMHPLLGLNTLAAIRYQFRK